MKKTTYIDRLVLNCTLSRVRPVGSYGSKYFWAQNQIKDEDFNYLLITLGEKVNIKLFLVVFHHIVLFRFEVKSIYWPGLGSGRACSFLVAGKRDSLAPVRSEVEWECRFSCRR